jgi:two-component system, chemotaxis family, chemotaxis protein CheY
MEFLVMKILVVDDELIPRTVLQRMLQAYGPCDVATNVVEALAAVRRAIEEKTHYQLICLDIEMPDGSGQDVLKTLRQIEADSKVSPENQARVLMTSSHSHAEQVKAAFFNGSDGFLVKPVEPERLVKKLNELSLINIVPKA